MYLKKVLVINPQNQLALKGLEVLPLQGSHSRNQSFSLTKKHSILRGFITTIILIFVSEIVIYYGGMYAAAYFESLAVFLLVPIYLGGYGIPFIAVLCWMFFLLR